MVLPTPGGGVRWAEYIDWQAGQLMSGSGGSMLYHGFLYLQPIKAVVIFVPNSVSDGVYWGVVIKGCLIFASLPPPLGAGTANESTQRSSRAAADMTQMF